MKGNNLKLCIRAINKKEDMMKKFEYFDWNILSV